MTNQSQLERTEYVQGHLFGCLKALKTFDAIRYIKDLGSGREYIRITDRLGGKAHLDVTGKEKDEILEDVMRLFLNSKDASICLPDSLVTAEDELMHIADLIENGGGLYE